MKKKSRYILPGRLPDLIALIQLLALANHTRRSERGITEQLKGKPQSADYWLDIAREHSEFFRVGHEGRDTPQASLIARVVQEPASGNELGAKREKLSNAELENLLKLAVQLYDKEMQRHESWHRVWLPSVIAIISTLVAAAHLAASFIFG